MKSIVVLSLALAALAPLSLGCGGVEYDREAEYPQQAVGYTPPQGAAGPALPMAQQQPMPQQQALPQEGDPNDAANAQGAAPQGEGDVAIGTTSDEYADTDPAALSDFRTTLDPYGTWVEDGTYGTVWVPSSNVVGTDFAPYVSAGHWTYDTDYVWVSDYSWGWAPFHYGRWTYIGGRGWGWIPGRTYAGAWVTWRTGYDDWGYVGWAPLPPTWYWHHGYAYGISVRPYAPYAFCGHGDLFYHGPGGIGGRIVTGSQVGVVAGHTRPYVPASPTVGAGGHVGAHPGVNGVSGPPPSSMKIPSHAVTPPPVGDRGLQQAQAYSHASTAQALGARPPAQSMAHNSAPAGGVGGQTGGRPPAGATSQPYARGTAPQTGSAYSHTPPTSSYRPSTPGYRPPASSAAAHPAPTYRPPAYSPGAQSHYGPSPNYGSTPHYGPSPSYGSTPHYGPAPSSGGSHYSAPSGGTYHASSGGSTSRPSSGGSSYHSSGGGGYHGGGGGGGRGGRR